MSLRGVKFFLNKVQGGGIFSSNQSGGFNDFIGQQ